MASATETQVGLFRVFSDERSRRYILDDLKIFTDTNQNGVYDDGDILEQQYRLILFISRDTSYLQEIFDKTDPGPGDVLIFLEDNTGDVFSGTSAWVVHGNSDYILVGPKVADELKSLLESGRLYALLEEASQQTGVQLTIDRMQLEELLKNGELQNTARTLAIALFQIINGFNILAAPAYNFLGDGILSITGFLRQYIEFQDYHWDPQAQVPVDGQDEPRPNEDFTPVLLPFTHEVLDALSEAGQDGVEKVTARLRKQLEAERKSIRGKLKKLTRLRVAGQPVPQSVQQFTTWVSDLMLNSLDDMITGLDQLVPFFAGLGKTWLNMINAFYCGLWNALVEAVLGLVDMLGYLFKLMGAAGDAMGNAQELIPQAQEIVDEFLQSTSEISFTEVISRSLTEMYEQVKQLDLMGWTSSITPERVAYFVGSFVGFVVETLIGIATGGASEVTNAMNKLERLGKWGGELFKFLKSSLGSVITVASSLSLESFMQFLQWILKTLRKGADEVVRMIRSLFDALRKGFRSAEEFLKTVMEMMRITSDQVAETRRLGMDFTAVYDNYCSICPRT